MMNLKTCLLGALALSLPVAAQAQDTRYWSVQGGIDRIASWPATVNFGGPTVDAKLDLRGGAQFGLAIGKRDGQARYELEYQHGTFAIKGVTLAGIASVADANGSDDAFTVNALRDVTLGERLSLHGGLGVGLGRVSLPKAGGAGSCQCMGSASKSGLVYQALLGLDYRLGDTRQVFARAGWLNLPGARSAGDAYVSYPRHAMLTFGIGYRAQFD